VISNVEAHGCTISWAPPESDGGSRISGYVIECREAKRSTWQPIETVEASENKLKVNDLKENGSYYFRVIAKNAIGLSEPLESETAVTIKRGAGVPDTPVPLLVSDIQADSCTLEWKAPSWTGGEDLKGYIIEMKVRDTGEWKRVADLAATCKTHTVKKLIEGNEYYFRISAYNEHGASKPLELNRPVIPKKKLAVPMPPTGPITPLTCNRDSITIQWGPPKDDGGAPINRYLVLYREVNKSSWIKAGTVDSDKFTCQVENLIENTDYHFRVIAENQVGQSAPLQTEEPIKARSPYNVPDKPEGPIVVTNITSTSATVSWKKPLNDGGSPILGYLIKRRDIKRPVWVKCGRVNADIFSANIRDLSEGSQYTVQIFAENSEGLSEPLDLDHPIAPKREIQHPESPASIECIGVDVNEVTLQWEPPLVDGGAPVKSYKIEMCKKQAKGESRNWTVVKELSAINTSYCVRDLKENQEYYFRISATNEIGTGEPKTIEKAVKPRKMIQSPSTPRGPIKVLSMEENTLTVGWETSKDNGGAEISNYVIEVRDALKANWNTVATVGPYASQYKITDLNENGEYFVRIRAQNEANLTSQPLETEASITIKSKFDVPDAPKDLKVVKVDKDKVTLEFAAPASDGGLPIRNFLIEKRDINRVTWVKAGKVKPKPTSEEESSVSATYTCEIEDLTPGAAYFFRVIAENQKGKSEALEMFEVIKMEKNVEKPSKPMDVKILKQKKPNSAMIEWKAPMYDGNDKISEYIVEKWSSDKKEWQILANVGSLDNSYIVSNLSDGPTYKFRVKAVNKAGQSEPSLETIDFKVQKNITIPEAPSGPLRYTISEDDYIIKLNWSEPKSDGGSKIKRYIIEKKVFSLGMPTEWTKVGYANSDENSFKVSDYNIEENTFSFRVIAENDAGRSAPLELSQPIVLEKKKKVPPSPTYLRVKDKTADSVTLSWKSFSIDTYDQAEKFIIEKKEKDSSQWTKCGTTTQDNFTVSDLDSNSAYFFRVIAINTAGESQPVEIQEIISMDISNEVPSIPISISVDNVTHDSVSLSWISPKSSGSKPIIGYRIYKQSNIDAHWHEVAHIHKSKKPHYTVTDLDHHYDYKFKVCAFSEIGIGKPIETEKVHLKKPLTPPSEPVNLIVTSAHDGQISISWMSPSKTGGSPITGYIIEKAEIVSNLSKFTSKLREDEDIYAISSRWVKHDTVDRYTLDHKLTHLNVGSLYSIRVAAENAVGVGKFAEILEPVIAKNLYSRPGPPTGPITITNITRETVDASWAPPVDCGGAPVRSYFIEKRDLTEKIWIKIARVDPDIRTLKIYNLVEGREYQLRVCAENEYGMSDPLVSDKFKPMRIFGNKNFQIS
jgi:predicted phage tail protein